MIAEIFVALVLLALFMLPMLTNFWRQPPSG